MLGKPTMFWIAVTTLYPLTRAQFPYYAENNSSKNKTCALQNIHHK